MTCRWCCPLVVIRWVLVTYWPQTDAAEKPADENVQECFLSTGSRRRLWPWYFLWVASMAWAGLNFFHLQTIRTEVKERNRTGKQKGVNDPCGGSSQLQRNLVSTRETWTFLVEWCQLLHVTRFCSALNAPWRWFLLESRDVSVFLFLKTSRFWVLKVRWSCQTSKVPSCRLAVLHKSLKPADTYDGDFSFTHFISCLKNLSSLHQMRLLIISYDSCHRRDTLLLSLRVPEQS